MKADDVVTAVRRRFGAESDGFGPEWAALDEFCRVGGWSGSRADLFLIRSWAGKPKGHERVLIEVKVSRSDLLAELARPEKMADLGRYAHRWYFATPVGLVKPTDDLGEGVGLLEVRADGTTREVRKAARRDAEPPEEDLIVEAFRRASRAEARLRDRARADAAATVAAMLLGRSAYEVESAAHALMRARFPVAFDGPSEARDHLGRSASGWRECYRASRFDATDALREVAA